MENQGRYSKMTPLDTEEGVKGQSQQLEKIPGHNILQVVFTFQIPSSNDKGNIMPF